jgi:hypothetical protein
MKPVLWNSIEPSPMPLCLIPKIFDAVYMIFAFSKFLGMTDSQMLEFGDIKIIVRSEMTAVNNALRPIFLRITGINVFSLTS